MQPLESDDIYTSCINISFVKINCWRPTLNGDQIIFLGVVRSILEELQLRRRSAKPICVPRPFRSSTILESFPEALPASIPFVHPPRVVASLKAIMASFATACRLSVRLAGSRAGASRGITLQDHSGIHRANCMSK